MQIHYWAEMYSENMKAACETRKTVVLAAMVLLLLLPLHGLAAKNVRKLTLRDIDGNRYVDFVGSWGPMILGHGHKRVVSAVRKQARRGLSYAQVRYTGDR